MFVTPEYNHSAPGALKNAVDFLYAEWTNKAAGFVGYGSAGGARAIEQLRSVLSCVQVAHVSAQVELSLYTDFEGFTVPRPVQRHDGRPRHPVRPGHRLGQRPQGAARIRERRTESRTESRGETHAA